MKILNSNILLFFSLYLKLGMGFHRYNMLTLTLKSNLTEVESRTNILRDPYTFQMMVKTPLDNFNSNEHGTWWMEVFGNYKYFKTDGPIILEIGGEGPNYGVFTYFTEQLARETGGALFSNQHRYYGESYTQFPSLNSLSSRQCLADLAHLLTYLKTQHWLKRSRVVVVGGSYAGNLAAWMRLLYSDLVDAAHASSAPILVKADYPEYMKHVSDVFKTHCEPQDYESIKRQFEHLNELLKTKDGIRVFKQEVNVCYTNNLLHPADVHNVFFNLVMPFAGEVQNGFQNNLKGHCSRMNYNLVNRQYFPSYCIGSFSDMADQYRQLQKNERYWVYQTCNEFGFFQTLSSPDHVFTQNLPVEFYYALCRETFGMEFSKETIERNIKETNQFYGGLNRKLTRVVFVNGDLDPWSRLSVHEDISSETPARVIRGATHCKDLHHSYGHPGVAEVQEFAKTTIKKWIELQ